MDQQILVPFDGSESSRTALNRALKEHPDAEITVLYVIDLSELSYGVEGGAASNLHEAEKEEARALFDEAQEQADEYGKSLSTVTEVGQPAEVIVEYAERDDIDHVIMGSHGRSGLSRILVGSVAEAVIRESPATVTIAR